MGAFTNHRLCSLLQVVVSRMAGANVVAWPGMEASKGGRNNGPVAASSTGTIGRDPTSVASGVPLGDAVTVPPATGVQRVLRFLDPFPVTLEQVLTSCFQWVVPVGWGAPNRDPKP